ncbi:hypothetical protein L6R50_10420 [Myxococcota bacterium]|nr:hypothetical protein [Myxococcota bacterium]
MRHRNDPRTHRPRALFAGAAAAAGLAIAGCAYDGPAPSCPPGGTALTWEGFAQPFYESYCTRCHASDLDGWYRQGAPGYWNYDDFEEATVVDTADGDLGVVWRVVAEEARMPPNSWVRPSRGEIADLGEWLACGQPE